MSTSIHRACSSPLLRRPGIRALLLLVVLTFLYVTYGFRTFYRDPLSIFFSEKHGFDRFYSATRQAEADQFLDAVKADPALSRSTLGKAGSNPEICAVFTTIGRDMLGRQYVDTALGSFLANMSRAERDAIHLKLFFADVPNPKEQHKSYDSFAAIDVADDIVTYPSTLPEQGKENKMATLAEWSRNRTDKHALERKTLHDYSYGISRCVQTTNAPYIAMLEGDILLADGWAARTLTNLRTISHMMKDPRRHEPQAGRVEPGGPNTWLYLRLFNQERSFGWTGGTGFRSNSIHKIAPAVSVPLFFLLVVARRYLLPRHLAAHLDGWTLLVVCGLGVPLIIWLFYASGKASLLGAPPGVHEEFFGCCNQALVYNRVHAQALADHLMAATAYEEPGRCDMLPRDFAWNRGLARISAYPMLAQHIGSVSATDTTSDEAKRVWSMAFENLRPARLARDHVRDVRELFGNEAARELEIRHRGE